MTLPELCECNESLMNMPKTTGATPVTAATPTAIAATTAGSASDIVDNKSIISKNTSITCSSGSGSSPDDNHLRHTTPPSLGEALKALLRQASRQGRVTCSLTSCVALLSARPDDVMLCVMPLLPQPDAAATIQSTLIRAVCLEHNIRILTVDCDVKLAKTVVGGGSSSEDEDLAGEAASSSSSTAAVPAGAMMMMMEEEEEEEEDEEEEEELDDNCNKVWKTPSACSEDLPLFFAGCDNLAPVMGFPCVLVRYPMDGASREEELVAEFCKEQLFDRSHQDPYIELPD